MRTSMLERFLWSAVKVVGISTICAAILYSEFFRSVTEYLASL